MFRKHAPPAKAHHRAGTREKGSKKVKQPIIKVRKRIPIRRRLLRAVLLTAVFSILAVSLTGYLCIRWIRSATEETLSEQLEYNLRELIQEHANTVDAELWRYEEYLELINDTIECLYADKETAISSGRMINPPEDTHEFALSRTFASETATEEELKDEILLLSNLEALLEPIARENAELVPTVYIATANGLLISYDRYSHLYAQPEGRDLIYNYYVSEWYRRGMEDDGADYTGVYMDFQGRGLTVTITSRFRDETGKPAGVACIDFELSALYDKFFTTDLENGTFVFAMDQKDTIISPDSDTLDLREYTGLTLDELEKLKTEPDGILEKDDLVYVCVPMKRVGWTLCARVPRTAIQESIHNADLSINTALQIFAIVVVLILFIAVLSVNRSVYTVIHPLELLRQDIQTISDGDLEHRTVVYRNDEIGDISSGINEMVDRLNFALNEMISSQQHADAMSRLATVDTLTGIRNKTAFDTQKNLLSASLEKGETEFGFAVVDLNNLKLINDNFGHDKGDIAIKNLCRIICDVFAHSAVFRVGGDEFVVSLQNTDYQQIDSLVQRFKDVIYRVSGREDAEPWDRVSAAIGYALYNVRMDNGPDSVLARADKEMYRCKKSMKGLL